MHLAPNTRLGRYEIRSPLGAGGMGEVYLAQDRQLERTVAIKILPADVAADKERMRRFIQEAKAAAALNHPNIAHIYEIGEAEGTHFISMEYVEGETLSEKIHREKTPLRKLLEYLRQAAEGLSKAHAAGTFTVISSQTISWSRATATRRFSTSGWRNSPSSRSQEGQ